MQAIFSTITTWVAGCMTLALNYSVFTLRNVFINKIDYVLIATIHYRQRTNNKTNNNNRQMQKGLAWLWKQKQPHESV